jgi:hypothetical protein
MFEKILMGILIALGVVAVVLLVVVIVMACNGAIIDSDSAWAVNPANPASPVHQVLF